MTGAIKQALAVAQASSVTMRGSRLSVAGNLISVPDDGHATFINNICAGGATTAAPIVATPSSYLVLRGNVFSGYARDHQRARGCPQAGTASRQRDPGAGCGRRSRLGPETVMARSDFEIVDNKPIGRGYSGTVFRARRLSDGMTVA